MGRSRKSDAIANKKSKSAKHSLFGPLRTRGGEPLAFPTARMNTNGASNRTNGRNHHHHHNRTNHNSKRAAKPAKKMLKKGPSSSFALVLPNRHTVVSSVPWLTKNNKKNKNSTDDGGAPIIIIRPTKIFFPTDEITADIMLRLDDELDQLARYVSLSQVEINLRTYWVDHLQSMCRQTFCSNAASSPSVVGLLPEIENEQDVSLQVFGSFGTEVCIYTSDVDIALWGVVPSSSSGAPSSSTRTNNNSTVAQRQQQQRPRSLSEAERKQMERENRKRKWLAAMESADADNELQVDVAELQQQQQRADPKEIDAKSSKDETVATERTVDDDDDLFVVDRAGNETSGDHPIFDIDRAGESDRNGVQNRNDNNSNKEDKTTGPQVVVKEISESLNDNTKGSAGKESESEVDSVDKMDAFSKRRPPAPIEIIDLASSDESDAVSSSSSSSDDDDEVELLDMNDFQVSVTTTTTSGASSAASLQHQPVRAPRRVRQQVTTALGKLHRKLQRKNYVSQSQFIQSARVPIIKLSLSYGFQTDVAIGGHNGADTSAYASLQASRYESFAPVVLALKTILHQTKLDEPFMGGLGSYKLYVLVAHHLEQHLSIGGQDRSAQVLLLFWFRYGDVKMAKKSKRAMCTSLSMDKVIRTRDGAEADLSNVYLIEHLIRLFQQCWSRTWTALHKHKAAVSQRPNASRAPASYLTGCIDSEVLGRNRSMAIRLATNHSQKLHIDSRSSPVSGTRKSDESLPSSSVATSQEKNSKGKSKNKRKRSSLKAPPSNPVATTERGDKSAAEIIAGYSVASGISLEIR